MTLEILDIVFVSSRYCNKILGTSAYREERFILAHKLRGLLPCSAAALSCGEAEHHVWECTMEEAAYLMVARKRRELGRDLGPRI